MLLFENSIRSEQTRSQYKYCLDRFVKFYKLRDAESLLKIDQKQLQIMIEDYVMYLKKQISPNSFKAPLSAIQAFLIINDISLNWKKIRKLVPAEVKKSGERGYSTEEVRQILAAATDKRSKAIIHFLAASGVRIGALEGLKVRHLVNLENGCKAALIYEGSIEEYWTFLTPEASKALDAYLEQRKNDGEYMDGESPVFRTKYQVGISKAKPLKLQSIKGILERIIERAGINTQKSKRYEVQRAHGFRKRFNTILKLNREINPNIIEKLMGHTHGLDGVYLKPTRDQCFAEYKKGISDLTIDNHEKLAADRRKLEQDRTELEKQRIENQTMRKELREMTGKLVKVTTIDANNPEVIAIIDKIISQKLADRI